MLAFANQSLKATICSKALTPSNKTLSGENFPAVLGSSSRERHSSLVFFGIPQHSHQTGDGYFRRGIERVLQSAPAPVCQVPRCRLHGTVQSREKLLT